MQALMLLSVAFCSGVVGFMFLWMLGFGGADGRLILAALIALILLVGSLVAGALHEICKETGFVRNEKSKHVRLLNIGYIVCVIVMVGLFIPSMLGGSMLYTPALLGGILSLALWCLRPDLKWLCVLGCSGIVVGTGLFLWDSGILL